ncbi:alpha carbonic anhydrase 7-like [Vicia villosa]|uniref:alpha carbonic anhydrase 7-like n=1 Tax=Vicia villosa TaxID=3911 RepID=UPI00273AD57D|nr:alpha carbonic anhydrase 7-like [Vicia villosa]
MTHQKLHTKFLSNLLILVTILLLSTKCIIAQEVENETEFDYIKGSKHGPLHWGELHKEWGACNMGRIQSPIDMINPKVSILPNLGMLNKNYKPQNATLKNRGHDIQVKWEGDAGSIKINGTEYFLHQAHFHSPSEHTISGRRYDVELHLVHESAKINGKSEVAVVGVLYMIGQPNSILTEWSQYIRAMINTKAEKHVGVVDPSHIQFSGKKYYKYGGSLTVPPCTEGVTWIIDTEIRFVSMEQMNLLREAVHDHAAQNARPLQALNQREIELFGP